MAPTVEVSVALQRLRRFRALLASQMAGESGPVNDAVLQWAVRTRAYLQQRFDAYSKGGGDWPPLADSTVARRRQGSDTILRDIGLLYGALEPVFSGAPGALEQRTQFGVRVGFGGNTSHSGGPATIADIAGYHQTGGGYLPMRRIIVTPTAAVQNAMAADMDRALNKLKDQV